jgi:hypothetical protein
MFFRRQSDPGRQMTAGFERRGVNLAVGRVRVTQPSSMVVVAFSTEQLCFHNLQWPQNQSLTSLEICLYYLPRNRARKTLREEVLSIA